MFINYATIEGIRKPEFDEIRVLGQLNLSKVYAVALVHTSALLPSMTGQKCRIGYQGHAFEIKRYAGVRRLK